ncbi:MAG TPA: hypothetical protein VGC67_09050 [Cellulomonas sp.]
MNAAHHLRVAAGAVVAVLALLLPASAAAADDSDLIVVAPAAVELVAPAPGHSTSWVVTVSRTAGAAGSPLALWLSVTGADGPLLHGDHPLHLTVTESDGTVVLDTSEVASVLGQHIPLADLDGSTSLTATASLPAAAGNEYQGADGAVRLTVTAEAPVGSEVHAVPDEGTASGVTSPSGLLARTGVEPLALLLIATALLGLGGTALVGRRRARSRATATPVPLTIRSPEEDR